MRIRTWGVLALTLIVRVATARADGVVVPAAHGEPDVADEADAFALILRGAVEPTDDALYPDAARLDQAAAVATAAHADWVVFAEVARDGVGLRASMVVVRASGEPAGAVEVQAGDGDLHELAARAVAQLASLTHATTRSVRPASLGELRPFVRAQRAAARGDDAQAAAELAVAEPGVAPRVPGVRTRLAAVWNDAALPLEARVRAAIAAATPRELAQLAAVGSGPVERAARAFAALSTSDVATAERELAGAAAHPLISRARVLVAQIRNDRKARDAALRELLARSAPDALLAIAGLPRGSIPDAMLRRALELASSDRPRLAALAGVAAAAVHQDGALARVAVAELDDDAVAALPAVIAASGAADGVEATRLAAELAMRAEPASAGAAIESFAARAPDDPRAQLYLGRLRLATGDARGAAAAFERAGRPREQARALALAGDVAAADALLRRDPQASSAEAPVIAARVALAAGDQSAAVTALRTAAGLAPASGAIRVALADALEHTGDAAGAAALRAVPVPLTADAPVTAKPRAIVPGPAPAAPAVAERASLAADALAPLLAAFPPLPSLARRSIVLVPLGDSGGGLFALHHADEVALRRALTAALASPPYAMTVSGRAIAPLGEPLRASELEAIAAADRAAAIMLYRITPDGAQAAVKLVLFTPGAADVLEVERTIDGAGLVALNLELVWLIVGVVLALILGAIIWTLRGRSELEVRIKTDPAGKDEAFCIEINHSSARPAVADPTAFRAQLAQAGQEVRRRGATLVAKVTRFRLSPGTWDVHLYGVYERGGEQRTLGPSCSQRVVLGRGKFTPLTFDLVPDSAEVRITIYDAQRARVGIWLDDREHDKVLTNGDGEAVLFAPIGSHTLKIEARGMLLEQPLVITSPRIERLQINVERERRLAEVSGGLSLKRTHAAASAVAPERELLLRVVDEQVGAGPAAAAPVAAAATVPMASAPAVVRAPAPSGSPAAPGMLLGRYRIVAELGRGAMGVVYRAHDTNLEREVAIKAMSSELRANPVALNLFTQEAKALAQLNHPNIVAVYDQATDGDDTYMMMELVDGTTLEAVLAERGPVPWRRALGVIDQLCAGLAYAHARKVIHRDIKPANIFVTADGRVKLGDFGLARVMRELAIRRTEIRGTPLYMAPEQITGTNVGHRADLYAVGCTLFELVTGTPPFTDGDVLYHQMNTPPPRPSTLRPELPPAFDELVLACLAKAPEDRIASADDIRSQLRVVLQAP